MYLIDANNLAGQLGWLKKPDFDKQLVKVLMAYFSQKLKKAKIVFDGNDFWAGRQNYGQVEIIYAHNSADDKIIALIQQAKCGQAFVLVTNDRELQERARQIIKNSGRTIKFLKASDFAYDLQKQGRQQFDDKDDKSFLSQREIEKINRELLELWT